MKLNQSLNHLWIIQIYATIHKWCRFNQTQWWPMIMKQEKVETVKSRQPTICLEREMWFFQINIKWLNKISFTIKHLNHLFNIIYQALSHRHFKVTTEDMILIYLKQKPVNTKYNILLMIFLITDKKWLRLVMK